MKFFSFILLCYLVNAGATVDGVSPFAIDFPNKKNITDDDYINIQQQIRSINIEPLLKELYPENQGYTSFQDFQNRCTKGLRQTLIDLEKGFFPKKSLQKIGLGGDMCFVSCCPYDGIHPELMKAIPEALKTLGFNGYFYSRVGGFPNPTGKEIRFVGIPYSFKIFLMLEAQQLGFSKVIWVDSRVLPLRDPTPLFLKMDETGSLILAYEDAGFDNARIFPKTKQLLKDLTGTDVVKKHISTQVFGLKMSNEKTQDFIKTYYEFAEMGTPFLSCFPEEFVFGSIFGKAEKDWPTLSLYQTLKYHESNEDSTLMKRLSDQGYYFYLRNH